MTNNYIIIFIIVILTLLLKFILVGRVNTLKAFRKNERLDKLLEKFPDNITICKQVLEILENSNVTIEIKENINNLLYTVYNNTIIIPSGYNLYTRLQTIAHECIHSTQSKKILWFHFIFTNLYLLYFVIISVLTFANLITQEMLHISILLILGIVHYSIRSYLETDAIIKSKYVSEQYMKKYKILEDTKKDELLLEYDKISNKGVLLINYNILFSELIKVFIYVIISSFK